MKNAIQLSALVLTLMFATVTVQAQKFGYINTAAILSEMPKVKQAEVSINNFQTQLQKKGQEKLAAFQQKLQAIQGDVEAGRLSPVQQQEKQKELEAERNELGQFEQDMMNQIQEKRNKTLQPIYDELNTAIKAVAAENGFQMIFDQAVLLYSEESADVSALVKSKLGI